MAARGGARSARPSGGTDSGHTSHGCRGTDQHARVDVRPIGHFRQFTVWGAASAVESVGGGSPRYRPRAPLGVTPTLRYDGRPRLAEPAKVFSGTIRGRSGGTRTR